MKRKAEEQDVDVIDLSSDEDEDKESCNENKDETGSNLGDSGYDDADRATTTTNSHKRPRIDDTQVKNYNMSVFCLSKC